MEAHAGMVYIRTHADADQDILAPDVSTGVNFTTKHCFHGHYLHLLTSLDAASCCMVVTTYCASCC